MKSFIRLTVLVLSVLAPVVVGAYGVVKAGPNLLTSSALGGSLALQGSNIHSLDLQGPAMGFSSNMGVASMATPTSQSRYSESGDEKYVRGTITAISSNSITVNGVTYTLSKESDVSGNLQVGSNVHLEYYMNPDGTFTVNEVSMSKYGNGNQNSQMGPTSNGSNYNNSSCSSHGDDEDDDCGSDDD